MRRQARKSAGGALIVRSASALQVWLWLLLFIFQNDVFISGSIQPGYLDFDNLPETNFTCTGKVIGGYYADLETSCQMFHVCTVGQQDEPMDIKFLCLNGTVFDQETRVCERVDEVDCTKSEKFYSLNLELYGSTAPPIITPEPAKPQSSTTEQAQQNKYSTPKHTQPDPFTNESPTTPEKINQSTDAIDSTEDPVQDYKREDYKSSSELPSSSAKDDTDLTEEYDEEEEAIDSQNSDYEEDYSHLLTTTTVQAITIPASSTKLPSTTTTMLTSSTRQPVIQQIITSTAPSFQSSLTPSSHTSVNPTITPSSTVDPSLLSPQEFIYRHRGPGSEAISFQRQSFRPADGIYITHAPPQQFDHFQYESSRTAPRPVSRPVPFVQRTHPTPYRATTIDPRNQVLRPVSTSSERHETTIKHRPQNYPVHHLPPQQQLPFNPFYYDRKRSDDTGVENKSALSARSVAPPTDTERPLTKFKSPPRVIVTASASVSDSNGKKLNYTVGNVVSAVKPIVPINYDDYKETDLIFDPFFLDVPKLTARRKTRSSNKYRKVFSVPATTSGTILIVPDKYTTNAPIASQATTIKQFFNTLPPTTVRWSPEDYVDDNYEPHAYVPPAPPLAILLNQNTPKPWLQESQHINKLMKDKANELKSNYVSKSKSPSSEARKISSQSGALEAAVQTTTPPHIEVPTCITSRSTDCRTRA